jgi:hypothetical protein
MILDKIIKIKINPIQDRTYYQYNYYKKDNYINSNIDEIEIEINIEHLNHTSKQEVHVKCDICDTEKIINYSNYIKNIKKYNIYTCSQKCAQIKSKQTCLKKYGVEYVLQNNDIKEKTKHTNLEKYGCENPMQNKEIKDKSKEILLTKYGVVSPMKNDEIKDKQQKTMLNLYGKKHALQVDIFLENCVNKQLNKTNEEKDIINNKRKLTTFDKYGVDNIANSNYLIDKKFEKLKHIYNDINFLGSTGKTYTIICEHNPDHIFDINYASFYFRYKQKSTICTICNPINSKKTGMEFSLRKFIEEIYDGEILINKKILDKKEIDIYLPEKKLAIEFNGLYWYNEEQLPNNYHLLKTEYCEKLGLQLIHIYEDDWLYKNDIIKSMLKQNIVKN